LRRFRGNDPADRDRAAFAVTILAGEISVADCHISGTDS
jgi:hypothetical protein